MAWIESHQELANHPKTKRLCRVLNINTPQAIGHLHLLWWWALDYAQDGCLTKFEAGDIAAACEWDGDPDAFLNALYRAEFVDGDDVNRWLHDWDEYGGKFIKERERGRERQRKHRASLTRDTPTRHAEVTRDSGGSSRVENSTEENSTETPPLAPPLGETKAKTKRATAMTDDWEPTLADYQWSNGQGFDPLQTGAETDKFRDHFKATGRPMKDWSAAWKNWMRRSREFSPRASPSNGTKPEDRRPAIPTIEQVLQPTKAMSPEKLAEWRAWREDR